MMRARWTSEGTPGAHRDPLITACGATALA